MNVRDSEVISGLLLAQGYELGDKPEEADVVIFNTCSVRKNAEEKVWSEIGRIAKLAFHHDSARKARQIKAGGTPRPIKKIIGLVGCMAQNYKEGIFERSELVDFAVGPSDIDKIPRIVDSLTKESGQSPSGTVPILYERKIWETDAKIRPEEVYHTGFYQQKDHTYVVISEGCSNYCTYCVVPYVRGELHHRKHEDILKEIAEALEKGITSITLLGQNVNAYNDTFGLENNLRDSPRHPGKSECRVCGLLPQNTGTVPKADINFVKLLRMVNEAKGLSEFTFVTSHPRDTSSELFRVMAECEKLKKCLHLPVQSGSDRILKLMNRGYTRKFYLDLAQDYRKIVKGGVLTTDIIVGFPGETEKDFQQTFDLVKEAEFNAGFIFKYSPRPNTEAWRYADDVPKEEKERRHALILKLQKKISAGKKLCKIKPD